MTDWISVNVELPKISSEHLLYSRAMLVHAEGMNFVAVYIFGLKNWVPLTEPNEYPDGWGMDFSKSKISPLITHWKNMDVPDGI